MFSELLLWGWLHRLYIERKLTKAAATLGLDERLGSSSSVDVRERARALTRLATAVDALDPYMVGHSHRVTRLVAELAHDVGLSGEELKKITAAAAVHDVGKLHVPRSVLNKPGKLTLEEYELVKRHATEGAAMVASLDDPEVTQIVRHHHERIDGTGYPDGLASEEIPIGARIVAVADTYDAIIGTRPYRAAAPHKRALDVLRAEAGKQLDSQVVEAFLSRYSGTRAVGLWAMLAVLPQLLFGRASARAVPVGGPRAVMAPPRHRDRGSVVASAGLALLATAVLGGGSSHPALPGFSTGRATAASGARVAHASGPAGRHHKAKPAVPTSLTSAAQQSPSSPGSGTGGTGTGGTPTVSAAASTNAGGPGSGQRTLVSGNATCQAYNPQLCTELGGPTPSSGSTGEDTAGSTSGVRTSAAGGSSRAGSPGGTGTACESGCQRPETQGTLPFTGEDLALVLGFALVLLAAGLALRKIASRNSSV
jgi:putative nucleotidyltransferase with HDIG domain